MDDRPIITTSHPFVKAVVAALRDRCGVEPGQRLLVAVSGGGDSVALLRALHLLAGRNHWRLDLHAAHINHKLRDQADADEAFVKDLAAALGVTVHCASLDIKDQPGNLESNARRMRYAALAEMADRIAADAVAVAHHADDQLETMLMRLIRGASVGGLAGMSWRRTIQRGSAALIRPMLGVDRAAVIGFLRDLDQGWCEDHTNADVSRWRARLRADVLPVLRELRPMAAAKAVQAGGDLDHAARMVRRQAGRSFRLHVRPATGRAGYSMSRDAARSMPPLVLTALVRMVCRKLGVSADRLDHATMVNIAEAAVGKSGELRSYALAGSVSVRVECETLQWMR